jgi:hypothetical protein
MATLVAAIGVTRNAVDSAANRMVEGGRKKGLLVRPKRGLFSVSPEALRKIERGDVLRVGKKLLVLSQLSMWPALDK